MSEQPQPGADAEPDAEPDADKDAGKDADQHAGREPDAPATPPTVLCVDDEANILSALRRLFRPAGYRILLANSGAEGLQLMETNAVDLVISDMRMPEMDGAAFLAQVRERWPHAIRLLLTGYSDVQSILAAINCGEIHRYITKPWDDNDILLVVRHALERRALEGEKQRLEALTQRQNEELKALNQNLEAKVEERTRQLKLLHDATVAANEKLKHSFAVTIKIISSMLEMRGRNLSGHARQVADLARKICGKLQLDSKATQDVFVAALLHDLGKIGFSDDMLAMPLTLLHGEQLGLFRKHPIRAEQLLMPLQELHGSAAVLRSQMERFDGNGFPDGLRGLKIPLGARILALAVDYYNLQQGAMVQRHLRADEAQSLIMDASGKRYDPNVVLAFRQVTDAGGSDDPSGGHQLLSGELMPGMVLARDLISRDGLMLLAADHVLDERMITQVQDFEKKSKGRLWIWVKSTKQ